MKSLVKLIWTQFTEKFGSTVFHPQYTIVKFQKEAIDEAKKYSKALSAGRQGKLVDIGCGRMPYRKELEPLLYSYIGVDHPKVAKLYKGGIKPEVLADAKKLPLKTSTFDIALLIQVLEHVDDPIKVIKEASRVLKPGGILIISVPFFYPLHDMPYDFSRYTASALKSFLKEAHLITVKFEVQGGFFEFWLQMLNTFLIKRINDMLKGFKWTLIVWIIILILISVPIILINNLLIIITNQIFKKFPKYPDYFPMEYLIVARKYL